MKSFFSKGMKTALMLAMVGLLALPARAEYPDLQKPKGDKCVQDTAWMRRNHMDFLKKQRNVAVREGIRVKDNSLLNCQTCHTSREQFCDKCHGYVGVQPDCFDCHNYPK